MRKGKRERDALRLLKEGHRSIIAANMAAPRERDLGLRGSSSTHSDRFLGRTHTGFRDPQNISGSRNKSSGARNRWALS